MTQSAVNHYNADYFAWQAEIGRFIAKTNKVQFAPFIRPTDKVLDFGCAGGWLLKELDCAERRGIEVNSASRAEATHNGVDAVSSTDKIDNDWADVIISNSVLEHTENPIGELRALFAKLRPGGRLVVRVPHETDQCAYIPGDINQHLFTWSPLNLGNAVTVAGYKVESVRVEKLLPPPRIYRQVYALLGESGFFAVARLYRLLRIAISPFWPLDSASAVIVVAVRPL
jgi:SAM-dependent methyltransferase